MSNFKVFDRRKIAILRYLAKFHFAPTNMLIELVGAPGNQFLYGKRYARLIESRNLPSFPGTQNYWRLTPEGREAARGYIPATETVNRLDTRKIFGSLGRYRNEVFLQHYLVQRFLSENIDELNRIRYPVLETPEQPHPPDCVLTAPDGRRIAIKTMLHPEPDDRAYRLFHEYVRVIREPGHYDSVRLVFASSETTRHYLDLLRAEEWPVFTWDSDARNYRKVPGETWNWRGEGIPLEEYFTTDVHDFSAYPL